MLYTSPSPKDTLNGRKKKPLGAVLTILTDGVPGGRRTLHQHTDHKRSRGSAQQQQFPDFAKFREDNSGKRARTDLISGLWISRQIFKDLLP